MKLSSTVTASKSICETPSRGHSLGAAHDWTNRFRNTAANAWHINAGSAIIDAEVLVPVADGSTDFCCKSLKASFEKSPRASRSCWRVTAPRPGRAETSATASGPSSRDVRAGSASCAGDEVWAGRSDGQLTPTSHDPLVTWLSRSCARRQRT